MNGEVKENGEYEEDEEDMDEDMGEDEEEDHDFESGSDDSDLEEDLNKSLKGIFNPLSANPTEWSNTLKRFVGNLPTNYLTVCGHFVGLALKRLNLHLSAYCICHDTSFPSQYFCYFSRACRTFRDDREEIGPLLSNPTA